MASNTNKPSYWHSPFTKPLEWITAFDLISKWAEEIPNREAYVVQMNGQPREAVTFRELKEKTTNLAAGLLNLGLKSGDFVIITGITSLDWILCDFACATLGIRTLRCRMSVLTKQGLLTIANRNNCKAIFFHPGEDGEFEEHLRRCIPDAFEKKEDGTVTCTDTPCLKYLIGMSRNKPDGMICVKKLMKPNADISLVLAAKEKVQPEDILTCYMTSGTTGFPKAIPFSHFRLLNMLRSSNVFGEAESGDRFLCDRSLSWLGGFMHLSIVHGLTTIYVHPLAQASDNDIDFFLQVSNIIIT